MRRALTSNLALLLLCAGCGHDAADVPVRSDPAEVEAQAYIDEAPRAAATGAPATAAKNEEDRRAGAAGLGLLDDAAPSSVAMAESGGPKDKKGYRGRDLIASPHASVQAGEWDDNANYREFLQYLESESHLAYHRVDLRHRRFLVVRDRDGKPVPGCPVTVSDGDRRVTLTTSAAGRAILFPHAEGLAGSKLTATTSCEDTSAQARFTLDAQDGVVDLQLSTRRNLPAVRHIDVAFVLDTTGSMSEEIAAVKATIQQVATALSDEQVELRIGLVAYKDRTDRQVTKVYPMTSNIAAFSRSVAGITAEGGGDTPEDATQGVHVALQSLDWDQGAAARVAFVIGDAPPHLDYQDGPDYVADMKDAAHRGIKLFTIAASGMDGLGQAVWRQLAQYTGASNMFVLRGGAGPQSTGGGDPKSSCGGTHDNYTSGKLDQLIVAKVRRELRALDANPMRIAGLDQDEYAKPCDQRVVLQ